MGDERGGRNGSKDRNDAESGNRGSGRFEGGAAVSVTGSGDRVIVL